MQHAQRRPAGRGQVGQVPKPPHVLKLQVPGIVKIDMRLRNVVHQQHPRPRPVQVGDKLHQAAAVPGLTPARAAPAVAPVRHNPTIVQSCVG